MCESECVSVSVLLGCLAQESLGEGGCAGLAGSGSMPRDDPTGRVRLGEHGGLPGDGELLQEHME